MSSLPPPPVAPKHDHVHTYYDQKLPDQFHYLADRDHKDTLPAIKAENAYNESVMDLPEIKKLQQEIYDESVVRMNETDEDYPVTNGEYSYYSRTVKGQQYAINCRKGTDGKEEIVVDRNAYNEKHITMGAYSPSPDNRYVAYSLDRDGSEYFEMYIKDLTTGKDLPQTIPKTSYGVQWCSNEVFLYTTTDEAHRTDKIWRLKVGQNASKAECIHHEKDETFNADMSKSTSGKYIFVTSSSSTTSEVYVLPLKEGNVETSNPTLFRKREDNLLYEIEDMNNDWLILHNDKAVNFKISRVAIKDTAAYPEKSKWVDVVANPLNYITGLRAFKDYLVLYERSGGNPNIRVIKADGNGEITKDSEAHTIQFEEGAFATSDAGNMAQSHANNTLRFVYNSFVTPKTDYAYDLAQRELKVLKRAECKGHDPSKYTTKTVYVPLPNPDNDPANPNIPDKIPMNVVYRTDLFKGDGSNPAYVYAYGSYGICMDPRFANGQPMLSLLDRGYVYAVPRIRGGSDCGYAWYSESGKFLHKKNSFYDFIASVDYLVKEKYTSKTTVAIQGGSAGGLLMGAVINLRPDIAKAFIANVPFVDVINTMMNDKLPLTKGEYAEWGPLHEDVKYFNYIKEYSPYDNIQKGKTYPNGRMTSGFYDPRVGYWEPAKWIAKMRDAGVTKNAEGEESVLTHECQLIGGHAGSSGRYEAIKDRSKDYAFALYFVEKERRRARL